MLAGPPAARRLRNSTRTHSRVRCPTRSAVCTGKDKLRTSRKPGRMFDRTHRAAPGVILCKREAGMNSINYFPRSVISDPVHFWARPLLDIPAPPRSALDIFFFTNGSFSRELLIRRNCFP